MRRPSRRRRVILLRAGAGLTRLGAAAVVGWFALVGPPGGRDGALVLARVEPVQIAARATTPVELTFRGTTSGRRAIANVEWELRQGDRVLASDRCAGPIAEPREGEARA